MAIAVTLLTTEFAEQGCLRADQITPLFPGKRLKKFNVVVQIRPRDPLRPVDDEAPMFGTEHVVVKAI